jgi:hypothetical protein
MKQAKDDEIGAELAPASPLESWRFDSQIDWDLAAKASRALFDPPKRPRFDWRVCLAGVCLGLVLGSPSIWALSQAKGSWVTAVALFATMLSSLSLAHTTAQRMRLGARAQALSIMVATGALWRQCASSHGAGDAACEAAVEAAAAEAVGPNDPSDARRREVVSLFFRHFTDVKERSVHENFLKVDDIFLKQWLALQSVEALACSLSKPYLSSNGLAAAIERTPLKRQSLSFKWVAWSRCRKFPALQLGPLIGAAASEALSRSIYPAVEAKAQERELRADLERGGDLQTASPALPNARRL